MGSSTKALKKFLAEHDGMILGIIAASISILFPFFIGAPLLIVILGYFIWQDRTKLKQTIKKLGWIGIFIAYSIIVSLINRNWIGVLATIAVALIALFFVYYQKKLNAELYVLLLKVFCWGSIPLAIMAIYQYLLYAYTNGYDLFYIFKYHNPQTRAEATFFNANYYGLYCVFVVVIAMYLFKKSHFKHTKLLSVIVLALNAISIILTASRWLLPTVVVAVVWLIYFLNRKYALIAIGASILVMLGLLINPDLLPRLTTLAYAFEDRFIIWETGWNIFLTQPLVGRGAMSYVNYYYLFVDEGKMHAHQLLIDTLANFGIYGVMILCASFTNFFRRILAILQDKSIRDEVGLITCFVVVVLFHGIMDMAIFWLQTGFIFLAVVSVPTDVLKKVATIDI